MSFAGIQPTAGAVMVTQSNLHTGIINKSSTVLNNVGAWHKFIVHNSGKWKRNEILTAILDYVFPLDLIPVAFGLDKFGCFFLARNCATAIKKLCNDNLVVPNPYDESFPFRLTLVLKFSTIQHIQIDVQKNITEVLKKRYDPTTKTLNLTKFHEDPGLVEFCPLFQPKILYFVLHLTKTLTPHPRVYILNECRLRLLNPFDALAAMNVNIVKSISLCGNLLEEVGVLEHLKAFKLHSLMLDGNPLCGKYTNCSEYIYDVKKVLPSLEILDEVVIKVGDFPAFHKVFLCKKDGLELVNDFIEYYFRLYDSTNRRSLQPLYKKNSMFSLNAAFHDKQITKVYPISLSKYINISRNLIKLADFSRVTQYLYKGPSDIANMLYKLPRTQHDPYSFKVDLMFHSSNTSIICVCGVFQEVSEDALTPKYLFGFSRTFVLSTETKKDGAIECYIVNELLHIYNAFPHQRMTAFSHGVSPHLHNTQPRAIPETETERSRTVDALKAITGLGDVWAKKCLDECHYDLKKSLTLFVDLYKSDKLPQEAFVKR